MSQDHTNAKSLSPYRMRKREKTDHGLERLANAALLLRDDVSKDPEARIHERDEEENGVEHSDHIEELAFSLRLIPSPFSPHKRPSGTGPT